MVASRADELAPEERWLYAVGAARALWGRLGPDSGWPSDDRAGALGPASVSCVALGLYALESHAPDPIWSSSDCDPTWLAVGTALALTAGGGERGPQPHLGWLVQAEVADTERARGAFQCAVERSGERDLRPCGAARER